GAPQSTARAGQHAARALDGDAVVLVSLIPRDLRLVDTEARGELPLRQAPRDTQGDQGVPEAVEVEQLSDVAALQALVALHLLLELEVERAERIQRALQLLVVEPHPRQAGAVLVEPLSLLLETREGFLILSFVADHGAPPILRIPRGRPSRLDMRKADGNSRSLPYLSLIPQSWPKCGYSSTR